MVAYNFKQQFAPLVESGAKRQTIRSPRRTRHVAPSEALQLYTGMRTKNCRKLLTPDPVCLSAESITLRCSYAYELGSFKVELNGEILEPEAINALAIADGFGSGDPSLAWFEMQQFFQQTHGLPFQGTLIKWEPKS